MRTAVSLALFLLLPALGAHAAPAVWHSQPDGSELGFTAQWQHTPVNGRFERFTVGAQLDPAHPAGGKITVHIATAGITTQSPDIARALRGSAWFDVKQFPEVRFKSQSITAQSNGSLLVRGTLTLKGHSQAFSFPLKLSRQGVHLVLDGRLTLQRTDFGIGSGQWSSGAIIAIPVTVRFHVVLGST